MDSKPPITIGNLSAEGYFIYPAAKFFNQPCYIGNTVDYRLQCIQNQIKVLLGLGVALEDLEVLKLTGKSSGLFYVRLIGSGV